MIYTTSSSITGIAVFINPCYKVISLGKRTTQFNWKF